MCKARDLRPDLYFPAHLVEENGLTKELVLKIARELEKDDSILEALFHASILAGKCPYVNLTNILYYFELLGVDEETRENMCQTFGCSALLKPDFLANTSPCNAETFLQQAKQPTIFWDEVHAYVDSLEGLHQEDFLSVPLVFVPKEDGDDASREWISIQPSYDPEKERATIDTQQQERMRLGRERRPHPIKGRPKKDSDAMPRPSLWMRIRQLIIWIALGLCLALLLRTLGCHQSFFGG